MTDFGNMESRPKFAFWCCSGCGNVMGAPTREDLRCMRAAELEALRYAGRMAGTPSPWDVPITPSAATKESP